MVVDIDPRNGGDVSLKKLETTWQFSNYTDSLYGRRRVALYS